MVFTSSVFLVAYGVPSARYPTSYIRSPRPATHEASRCARPRRPLPRIATEIELSTLNGGGISLGYCDAVRTTTYCHHSREFSMDIEGIDSSGRPSVFLRSNHRDRLREKGSRHPVLRPEHSRTFGPLTMAFEA